MAFFLGAWLSVQEGGLVMLALAALSILLYRSAFGTLLFVRRFSVDRATERIDPESNAVEIEYAYAQTRRELSDLVSRQVAYIGMLAAAAPLLGLLGTVIGMLDTFESLSQRMQETTSQVSSGVRFALVTTQAGLTVAIPAIFVIQWIRREGSRRQRELTQAEFAVAGREGRSV